MDKESRIAFVHAQVACALAEIAAMQSENQTDLTQGRIPHWNYQAFMDVQNKYLIGHNSVIEYLRD
jgi:hypothetical protein